MAARANPVVFVHGCSDKGASWAACREVSHRRLELDPADMRTCTYVSLNNEVTIKDLAEAFVFQRIGRRSRLAYRPFPPLPVKMDP
jgi:hypothetical protein